MSEAHVRISVMVTAFMIGAGVLDSLAFTYSAGVWKGGRLIWAAATKAAASFALGIAMYWGAIRYLGEAGVVLPEIQTLIWFSVTIIGVTILGGRFVHWPVLDQIVAANVLVSLGWLITRTSA